MPLDFNSLVEKQEPSKDLDFNSLVEQPLKKKSTPLESSVTPSKLPSQDKFQQGLQFAQEGFKMPSAEVKQQQKQQGWLLNTVSALDKGFYKNLVGSPVKGLGTLLQGTTKKVMGGTGEGFVSDALIKFGDYFNKTIDELTPQDEEFKNSLTDQVAQALGQVGSMVLTGAAAGMGQKSTALVGGLPKGTAAINAAKGLGKDLVNPVSVSAGLSMGQAEFEKAKEFGANDDQAFEAFYKNAAVGSVLEQIPTMQFLKRFNQSTAGGVANYVKTKGVAGITGGLEELTTEVLQQLYANKTAKDIYNINQNLFEGVAESGGIGFGVGFLLNALGANAKILRKQGKKEDAQVVEDQMKEFESKMEADSKFQENEEKSKASVIMPEENIVPDIVPPTIPSTAPSVIMPEENIQPETTVISPQQQVAAPSVIMPEANIAPDIVQPVEEEVKPEIKSKLEAFKTQFAPQPKEITISGAKAAETRRINQEAAKIVPMEEESAVLAWLAGKDSELEWKAINEAAGKVEGPSLNVGKDFGTEEVKIRDYAAKDRQGGETLNNVVHSIWEDLSKRNPNVKIEKVQEALLRAIRENPKRSDAARNLVSTFGAETRPVSIEEGEKAFYEGKGEQPQEMVPIEFEGGFVPFKEEINVTDFSKDLEKKYNLTLDVSEKGDDITLSRIIVPKESRKQGIGSKAMQELIDYADANNKRILLTPSTDFGATSTERLKEFYKEFGFVENKGKNKDFTTKETMYREPSGFEEAPFAVQEGISPEVEQMRDIVKDYINEGTTSLPEIKKAIAKELGYNTKKLRQTIEDAYNQYTKTTEAATKEVVGGILGRIGNSLKKMFGKEAQKPFIAKDSNALQIKLDEIRDDVKFQISGGFRSNNDMPIAYRYDTDVVARERFDIPKLKQIGAGSDRVVFDLGDGKVLKVAKTPRGLEQNIHEGDYYLSGNIIPEVFERGLNYVVVEKIEPPLKSTKGYDKLNDLLTKIQKFTQKDFDQHNSELQDVMYEYDLGDVFNYDILWNDFTAKRNWGIKDGQPLHLDGGTFGGVQMLDRFKGQKPLSDSEFRDIYNRSKKAKIENKDADKFTKFMAMPTADINRMKEKESIIEKAKANGTFLKAPNGKKSNLNESQWVSVRTKEFKKWFGDWENNPEKSSKVVDKNGEPRVVYHGTNVKFDKFDKSKLGSKNWMADSAYTGFFFAGDKKTSQAYVGMNNADMMGLSLAQSPILTNITDKYKSELEAANKAIEDVSQVELEKDRKKYEEFLAPIVAKLREDDALPESAILELYSRRQIDKSVFERINSINNQNGNSKRLDDIKSKILDEVEAAWLKSKGLEPVILNLFINVRNPLVIDFENNESSDGLTRSIEVAKLNGNDGVVFNNLADGGDIDDIFVAFEPNQIKSAEKNEGMFSVDDERINYMSENDILGFTFNNKMYLNGSALNPNTPIHEAGHIWVEWTKTNDPKIYAKGMELVKDSPYYKKAKESKFYQEQANNLSEDQREDYYSNEALAMAIGDKGAQFVVESKKASFKDWLKTLWSKIKNLTGFKDLTAEEFQNLTFEEFSKMAVKEILGVENNLDKFNAFKSFRSKKNFVKANLKYESNKNAIDELDFTEEDLIKIVKANFDLSTFKNIKNAVQERSAKKVLQRPQGGVGEGRGGRKRVEPRVEGEEVAPEGKVGEETQPEGITQIPEEIENVGLDNQDIDYVGITESDLNKLRKSLGLPKYQGLPTETHTMLQEIAQEMIKKGVTIQSLYDKIRRGDNLTNYENAFMAEYRAALDMELKKNPSRDLLDKIKEFTDTFQVGASLAGKALESLKIMKKLNEANTLSNFLLSREEDKGFALTGKMIAEETARFEKLQEAKAKLEESANVDALEQIKNEVKKEPKKSHEEYVQERKEALAAAREALRKLRSGEEGLMVSVPGLNELIAVAPHMNKYVKSLYSEGISKLDDIVTEVHKEFSQLIDGLTKRDVLDVITGKYTTKRRTVNEVNAGLRLLRREADLLLQLEKARKNEEEAENSNQIAKITRRIQELERKIKEVRELNRAKEMSEEGVSEKSPSIDGKTDKEYNERRQKFLNKKIKQLEDDLKNKKFDKEPAQAPTYKISDRTKKMMDRVVELEKEIAVARYKDQQAKLSKWEKAWDKMQSVLGLRRIIQTSIDASIWFRQLAKLTMNPRKWDIAFKFIKAGSQSIFSQKNYDRLMYEIHKAPDFEESVKDGIKYNELGTPNEMFPKSFLFEVPILREPFLASQRIADGSLNVARYELYNKYKRQLLKDRITRESDPEMYKAMSKLVMNSTGSGNMLKFFETKEGQKAMGALFYGAKLMAANINTLNPVYYARMPKEVRREAMKDLASYTATVMSVVLAAVAAGGKVSFDPDEPEFLQVRFGEKVYDFTAGQAAYIRTFLRMVEAVYARAAKSKFEAKEASTFAWNSTLNFFRNKLAPNNAYLVNAIVGKNSIGEDFDPMEVFHVYPMYADDAYEAAKEDGFVSLLTVLLPNIIGVGYSSYYSDRTMKPMDEIIERAKTSDEMEPKSIREDITMEEFKEFAKLRDKLIEEKIKELYKEGIFDAETGEQIPVKKATSDQLAKEIIKLKREATTEAKNEFNADNEE